MAVRFGWFLIAMALALGAVRAAAAPPEVVVSIEPVHSLVAGVMEGIAEPRLLIRGGASPHNFSLRPSDARALAGAGLVVWVGENLETFLRGPLTVLASDSRILTLMLEPAIALLPSRAGGVWGGETEDAAEGQDHAPLAHEEGAFDPHIWLAPANAAAIVRASAVALADLDPANAARYGENERRLLARIEALEREIAGKLAPLAGRPYLVFHDAYRYFEDSFGIAPLGSVTVSPERKPGLRRVREIRTVLRDAGALCIFTEPQFEPALVDSIIEGTATKTGILDPLGTGLQPGPDAYFGLMRAMAGALAGCLAPAG